MDRRVIIFFIFALVCAGLVPLADPQHRWVAESTSGAYVLLSVLFAVDSRFRNRPTDEQSRPSQSDRDPRDSAARPQN